MEHPKFRAAFDLLELRAQVENNTELQRLAQWWGEFQASAPPEQKGCLTSWTTILLRAAAVHVRVEKRRVARVPHDDRIYRAWR